MLLPKIIQGGLGIHTSNSLARPVSINGGLGTLTGPCAEIILSRILQKGDPGGHFREALTHFPFPKIASIPLDAYFVKNGIPSGANFKRVEQFSFNPSRLLIALSVCANFCLVWLAKNGHSNPVSINYLEKLQLPHIFSLTGAMLAEVDVVTMGAGIPIQVPKVLDCISRGENPTYHVSVAGSKDPFPITFDLREFFGKKLSSLKRPSFLPVISTPTLAAYMLEKAGSTIEGFVYENPTAGGHSAPPRGKVSYNEIGEPIYSEKDELDTKKALELGLPFWIGGSFASPLALYKAEQSGARGIQVGSIFALTEESGMNDVLKKKVRKLGFRHSLLVKNNPDASPTGFPFKVAGLEWTLSDEDVYQKRTRVCDVRCLAYPFLRTDEKIGFRCSAENELAFENKGGNPKDTDHAVCLCNGLLSSADLGSPGEPPVVTMGKDLSFLPMLMRNENDSYSVAEAMEYLTKGL